jgi:hypothetical protein
LQKEKIEDIYGVPVNIPIAQNMKETISRDTHINTNAIATFFTVVYPSSSFLLSLAFTNIRIPV